MPTPAHYALRLNYKICPIVGKGNAVIATRPIKRGECIMTEKPFLIRDRNFYDQLKFSHDSVSDSEYEDEKKKIEEQVIAVFPTLTRRTDEDEKKENDEIMAMVKTLPKERQRAFLELHCSTPGRLPFLGIFQANALPLITSNLAGQNIAVFLELSRLNHDCAPNAEYSWNAPAGEARIFAVSDIQPGQEITINYWMRRWDWKSSRSLLYDNYKFHCTCRSVCGKPGDELKLKASAVAFNNVEKIDATLVDEWRLVLYPEESLLNVYRRIYTEHRSLHVKDSRQAYAFMYAWLVCVNQGDIQRARVFATRCVTAFKDCLGSDDPVTNEMKQKTANPTISPMWKRGGFWSWNHLTDFEKRMTKRDPDVLDHDEHEQWLWRPGKIFWIERDYTKMFMEIRLSWRDKKNEGQNSKEFTKKSLGDLDEYNAEDCDDECSTDRDEAFTEKDGQSTQGDEKEGEEEEKGKDKEKDGRYLYPPSGELPGLGRVYVFKKGEGIGENLRQEDIDCDG